jgi:hypothetical protein
MNKYIFHISKFVKWSPRSKQIKKRVEIMANDGRDAYKQIETFYPEWQINMFWPDWKPSK